MLTVARRVAALALLLLGAPAGAQPPPGAPIRGGAVTEYDLRFGPVRLLTLRATVAVDGATYRATSEMQTVGIAAFLFPWKAESSSEGRLHSDRLEPVHHVGNGDYRGQRRSVVINYDDGGAVASVVQPPPENDWRDAVPVALQQHTLDPLTATLAAVAFRCRGTLPVFDGRRRYDMQLTDLGETDVPDGGGLYQGRARHCRAVVDPVAGFWRASPHADERPSQLDYWIATPRADLPPIPVYLEVSSKRGTLAVHLRSLESTAAPQGG